MSGGGRKGCVRGEEGVRMSVGAGGWRRVEWKGDRGGVKMTEVRIIEGGTYEVEWRWKECSNDVLYAVTEWPCCLPLSLVHALRASFSATWRWATSHRCSCTSQD